ncbi:MAG: LysR family transcriptional regulator [Myxococcota bacterium]
MGSANATLEIPWSDLPLVLAVARSGTLRAAATALRLSHPTVSRRLAELQESLGVKLFEREGRGLRLTAAGEDLAQTAAAIEAEVDGLSRRIAGRDHRLEGVVRVAASPSMFTALTGAVPAFRAQHPGIALEFVTGLTMTNLTRREADVAIRITDAPPESLVGRRLSTFEQAVFVHRALRDRMLGQGLDDPKVWPWVDWDEGHQHHASARWMQANVPASSVIVRCDSSLGLHHVVASGAAVGFVPTMLAGPHPELIRLDAVADVPVFHRPIWVLTHADLRNVGRVRATLDWLGACLHVEGGGPWHGRAPGGVSRRPGGARLEAAATT